VSRVGRDRGWADHPAARGAAWASPRDRQRHPVRSRPLSLRRRRRDCFRTPERRRQNPPISACRAPAPRQTRYRRSAEIRGRAGLDAALLGMGDGAGLVGIIFGVAAGRAIKPLEHGQHQRIRAAQLLVEDGLEAVEQVGLVLAASQRRIGELLLHGRKPGWRRFPTRWRKPIPWLRQDWRLTKQSSVADAPARKILFIAAVPKFDGSPVR